jgi:hypothetical protein
MAIAQSTPIRFTPRGLVDAFDATDVFPGACRKLQNLVFDPSNPELIIARPGVGAALTNFVGFTTPAFVSLQVVIGTRVYGMVATGLTAGHDEPFVYDLVSQAFITVTGVTAGNAEGRPTSPAVTGAWTPPTLTIVGIKVIITHPGYTGAGSNFFGVIDITNPAAPAYSTMNTATNGLPGVPTFVANLNNRAYFAVKNQAFYSDVLTPTVMTNAGQALTLGDSTPITALSGLPVQTTSAGVIGALLAFKVTQIWQITGDAAVTGSLSLNYISLNVGTLSPRSVVSTPFGVFFAGTDAAYIVSPYGAVTVVAHQLGSIGAQSDLRTPFNYVTTPSRVAAAFAGAIYRICIPTIVDGVSGTYDYWFDTTRLRWNGPHTFEYGCASSTGDAFILSSVFNLAQLLQSLTRPNTNTIYTDLGVPFNIDMKSSDFPKRDEMAMKQVVESTIELSSSGMPLNFSIQSFNDRGNFIASAGVTTQANGAVWNSFLWGSGQWSSSATQPITYTVPWPIPLVFNKLAIEVSAVASSNTAVGTFYARTQRTGYTLQS